ncbi:hypothetical protein AQUCO_02700182v1 [Aquilegia coerulea]|nr:hypothetical protein AQUCO_02700182v1 [Aquilegia coerulea]
MSKEDSMSTDEDELQKQSSASEYDEEDDEDEEDDDDDDDEDADSGMGSDDVDLSELGEVGEELCQVGNQICSVPFELYDLSGLSDILSVDVWNDCLTEEERFGLSKYLPDMDQEAFLRTLKELFSGDNFHFGSPLVKLFDMLKGGLCEPRVMLYQHGWSFFQKFRHYHHLRKYQNSMVGKFVQINNAWLSCKGYGIEERLRVLNLMRSQKSLMYEKGEDVGLETDSSGREEIGDGFWTKRPKPKMGRQPMYTGSAALDISSGGRAMPHEMPKYGKQNAKGILKLAGSNISAEESPVGLYPSSHRGMEMKAMPYGSMPMLPRKEPFLGYDMSSRQGTMPKGGLTKVGRQHEHLKNKDFTVADTLIGIPLHSQRKNWNVNQMPEMNMKHDRVSLDYSFRDAGKRTKYLDKNQHTLVEDGSYTAKIRAQAPLPKANLVDGSSGNQNYRHIRTKEEGLSDDWDIRGDNRKIHPEFRTNKKSDSKVKSYGSSLPQVADMFSPSHRSIKSQKKIKREPAQNGLDLEELSQSDETESDSSEPIDEEERTNLLRSKSGYPSGVLAAHGKANKLLKKEKVYSMTPPGAIYSSRVLNDNPGERPHLQNVEVYTLKGKQKGKFEDPRYLQNYSTGLPEESGYLGYAKMTGDDGKKAYKSVRMHSEVGERMHRPLSKAYPSLKKKKGFIDHDYHVQQSHYVRDHMEEDSDMYVTPSPTYLKDSMKTDRMGKKGQSSAANDRYERPNMPLLECSSGAKKRKVKVDLTSMSGLGESDMYCSPPLQVDDPSSLKKRGKREVEVEGDSLASMNSEAGVIDIDPDTKPGKKPFTLITPSIHTGFSFSIIHLLSAVRVAMVTPLAEDGLDINKHIEKSDEMHRCEKEEQNGKHETVNGNPLAQSHDLMDANITEQAGRKNVPSLTVQEIVNRVRSNPGDPCILETQEPLQDLVRGVLKIFASKTAPLGAKGWKALVLYQKSTKSWKWIGPVTSGASNPDTVEEVTSYEAWGLPHKMLVKLVDSFANWLKNGQETLQQIGSLPAPPLTLMQPNLDEKERFRDLRAQKSLTTISPSSEEVRAYFRREEILRYSVPDRAFSYTAADGRKSIVAPLRRGGGKPTSKARDHPILKPDRPPHVTILCLVRDAAARLPGSIGTRADVCTLIRDSQYIVEDVTDAQVNQVVSGALDRLHYERDPCVQFDGERKLWVYLHRDREEEDFEDDGTSSTKKWKRPRKDAAEQSDATVNVAFHGVGEQVTGGSDAAFVLGTDPKVEPTSAHTGDRMDLVYHSLMSNEDDNSGPFGSERDRLHQSRSMDWDVLGLNSLGDNKMLCQENSTNEDYDDETYSRDRRVGLLSSSIKNGVT